MHVFVQKNIYEDVDIVTDSISNVKSSNNEGEGEGEGDADDDLEDQDIDIDLNIDDNEHKQEDQDDDIDLDDPHQRKMAALKKQLRMIQAVRSPQYVARHRRMSDSNTKTLNAYRAKKDQDTADWLQLMEVQSTMRVQAEARAEQEKLEQQALLNAIPKGGKERLKVPDVGEMGSI